MFSFGYLLSHSFFCTSHLPPLSLLSTWNSVSLCLSDSITHLSLSRLLCIYLEKSSLFHDEKTSWWRGSLYYSLLLFWNTLSNHLIHFRTSDTSDIFATCVRIGITKQRRTQIYMRIDMWCIKKKTYTNKHIFSRCVGSNQDILRFLVIV